MMCDKAMQLLGSLQRTQLLKEKKLKTAVFDFKPAKLAQYFRFPAQLFIPP